MNKMDAEADRKRRNVCTICGSSRSRCGYCHGSRKNVLYMTDPPVDNNDSTDSIVFPTVRTAGSVDEASTLKSYNLIFDLLTVETYQSLLDRGWRRSGRLLYRPHNFEVCCPMIPIRLQAVQFQKSRSQRRTWNRFSRQFDSDIKETTESKQPLTSTRSAAQVPQCTIYEIRQILEENGILQYLQHMTANIVRTEISLHHGFDDLSSSQLEKICSYKVTRCIREDFIASESCPSNDDVTATQCSHQLILACSMGPALQGISRGALSKNGLAEQVIPPLDKVLYNSYILQNANIILNRVLYEEKSGQIHLVCKWTRLHDTNRILMKRHPPPVEDIQPSEMFQALKDFITRYHLENTLCPQLDDTCSYQLRVRSVPACVSSRQIEVHRLFTRYQADIHGDMDPYTTLRTTITKKRSIEDRLNSHPTVDEESSKESFFDDDHQNSFWLTKDDIMIQCPNLPTDQIQRIWESYISFARFLCDSPFPTETNTTTDPTVFEMDPDGYDIHIPYGCYHQQYHILHGGNEYLFAVGVVDVLPSCVSSVYSFFDPELSKKWNLGKVTALREIEWIKRAQMYRPAMMYYYLGYYIKSCPKMCYKAEYKPSSLLCPTHFKWVDFSSASERLDHFSPIRNIYTLAKGSDICTASTTASPILDRTNNVLLDVGFCSGNLVHFESLSDAGRNILYPFVKEFVDEIGDEIASTCVIKF